jgi:CRISPR/Cas system-associated exonuclease Cas4 (RecB family)
MKDEEAFEMPLRCLDEATLPDDGFDLAGHLDSIAIGKLGQPWTRKTGVYHPSSMYGCIRALYYDRIGLPPKSAATLRSLRYFEMGHAIHDRVQKVLQEDNPEAKSEVPSSCEELHIAGSCDLIYPRKDWIIEIKTIGQASFDKLVYPYDSHIWQVHCYMFMHDIPRAQILYINRNTGEPRMFRIKFSNKVWDQILDKISKVESFIEEGKPPEGNESRFSCYECKFKYECSPSVLR